MKDGGAHMNEILTRRNFLGGALAASVAANAAEGKTLPTRVLGAPANG